MTLPALPLLADPLPSGDLALSAPPVAPAAPGGPTPVLAPPAAPVPVAALPQLAIAVATDPGSGQIDLRLAPEELGAVRMHIHCEGNDLRVLIVAERAETLDLLRRNGAVLASELADAGFGRAALDFAQGGAGGRDTPPRARPADLPNQPEPAAVWLARPPAAAGRLDLRL
jgi:hypothetical protein